MSCFKPSLCTEEREREGWGDWKGRKGRGGERERGGRDRWGGCLAGMERGKREREGGESGEGGIGGVAGMEREKREREGGAAGKVGGWKCRVRLGYLLFRFRMFPFIFFFRFK